MSNIKLLSSAPTLEDLERSIRRFYGHELKHARMVSDTEGEVLHNDGRLVTGVRIIKKGKRYRFEAVEGV